MRNIFKNFLAALAIFGCLSGAHAQIPVTDLASLTQQIQQVAAWAQQIQGMKDQLTQQQQLFNSMNGARGIGQLLNNPELKNALPADWQKVYSSIQSGGYAGLTGAAKAIRDANAIYDCSTGAASTVARCNRESNKAAQDKAFASDAYASAQRRLDNIQGLMGQIDNTTDAKQIFELQARMQAENAMIQNEQTKLMMFKMMADSEDKLIAQQQREQDRKDMSNRKSSASSWVPPKY
ncbi:MAG: P-type DNA transfer protein VirB5 [Polaromonas sp.]